MYNIAYYTEHSHLLTEKVSTSDAYAALDIAHSRQPILATFCNSKDPKHPSKHISPQGIEVRVLKIDEDPTTDD